MVECFLVKNYQKTLLVFHLELFLHCNRISPRIYRLKRLIYIMNSSAMLCVTFELTKENLNHFKSDVLILIKFILSVFFFLITKLAGVASRNMVLCECWSIRAGNYCKFVTVISLWTCLLCIIMHLKIILALKFFFLCRQVGVWVELDQNVGYIWPPKKLDFYTKMSFV